MGFFDDDVARLYFGWGGNYAHPDSPNGGGGPGVFREAGPLGAGNAVFSRLPHPDSPAAMGITPQDITIALNAAKSTSTKSDLKKTRIDENRVYLKDANVKAFLSTIGTAEGGDYNLNFGGVKGKKDDKWQFSDFTTHPGPGSDGKTTAAGMYQINRATWKGMGDKMGLTDFTAETQDLLAIEILRTMKAIDSIKAGDIDGALALASHRWAALPQGKDKPNRYPGQPYMKYDDFIKTYKANGGSVR